MRDPRSNHTKFPFSTSRPILYRFYVLFVLCLVFLFDVRFWIENENLNYKCCSLRSQIVINFIHFVHSLMRSLRSRTDSFTSFSREHIFSSLAKLARSYKFVLAAIRWSLQESVCSLSLANLYMNLRASALVEHSFLHKIVAHGELVHLCCVGASAPLKFTLVASVALLSLGIPSYHTAQGQASGKNFREKRLAKIFSCRRFATLALVWWSDGCLEREEAFSGVFNLLFGGRLCTRSLNGSRSKKRSI